jgi:hypothetical protein
MARWSAQTIIQLAGEWLFRFPLMMLRRDLEDIRDVVAVTRPDVAEEEGYKADVFRKVCLPDACKMWSRDDCF